MLSYYFLFDVYENEEVWEALQANVGSQGQKIAKHGVNTKEAEMRTRERKGL